MKIAFAGLHHGHIFSLYDKVLKSPEWKLAGVCEESPEESLLAKRSDIKLTHTDFNTMLKDIGCDVIAIGDYYAKRGEMIKKALLHGKHVISDKPLCTSLAELEEISRIAKEKNLKIGCMYEMRGCRCFTILRELIAGGVLGDITQIQFNGQHPLAMECRPRWYFEAGKHGGTINDIAGHAIDIIPWITGLDYKNIIAARCWKSLSGDNSHMLDAAQFMVEMSNGCGVMGDVSYHGMDSFGFTLPTYWRFNVWGTRAMAECCRCGDSLMLYENGKKDGVLIDRSRTEPVDYLAGFYADINGMPADLNTDAVLHASRFSLKLQAFADQK